jgi:HEPN domain-containing protein
VDRGGDRYQARRWLMTAKKDLQAAEVLFASEMHAHACFQCHQAGAKAVRALWRLQAADFRTPSIKRLVIEFPGRIKIADLQDWAAAAALLDKFYIPTRYPNGLPDLTPDEIYGKEDGRQGIEAARLLVAGCEQWLQEG